MLREIRKLILGAGCLALVNGAAISWAVDPPGTAGAQAAAGPNVVAATTFRASKLIGLHVRNHQGERLGLVEDLVINVDNGKVAYAAMGVGGLFGLGEKLFAIPFNAMTFGHGKNEMYFVIDMSKEKLQAAPGFDKQHWPNFADPDWADQIDNYYRATEAKTGRNAVETPRSVTTE